MQQLENWFDAVIKIVHLIDPRAFVGVDLEKAKQELVSPSLWIERREDYESEQREYDQD